MKNHPFSVINPCSMMKKKVLLLFSAASPSSLSTIGAISEIRSFSYIFPSSLSNNQSPPALRLHRLPLCPPFVTFEKFVVFQIKSPPPCQTISPLHPLRLHRLPLRPPFVTFEKFVVFQIHSPPSEGSGEVPSTLSSVSSLYVSTIRAISEIRSLVSISAF